MRKEKDEKWNKDSIRRLRKHLGLTQVELAQELGTRQQTISEWEQGLYQPRGTSSTVLHIIAERSQFEYMLKKENSEAD